MDAREEVPSKDEEDGLGHESSDWKGIGYNSITQMLNAIEALIGKHHHSDIDEEVKLMKNMERLDENFHVRNGKYFCLFSSQCL